MGDGSKALAPLRARNSEKRRKSRTKQGNPLGAGRRVLRQRATPEVRRCGCGSGCIRPQGMPLTGYAPGAWGPVGLSPSPSQPHMRPHDGPMRAAPCGPILPRPAPCGLPCAPLVGGPMHRGFPLGPLPGASLLRSYRPPPSSQCVWRVCVKRKKKTKRTSPSQFFLWAASSHPAVLACVLCSIW
jgi:hypothetical protein